MSRRNQPKFNQIVDAIEVTTENAKVAEIENKE